MSVPKADMLKVPGASLYYEVRGSGPLLLMIQGGGGNAGGLHGVASQLVDHYTVVTYDRRGLSRSTLDNPAESPRLETQGDDAQRLLAALTSQPALVFGASLGAVIGLDLVARHPEQVRVLVAHEPPAAHLLSAAERAQAEADQADLEETYAREGVVATMKKFIALTKVNFDDREPDVELPAPSSHSAADREFFLTREAPSVHCYRLDIAALRAAATRIVPAGGRTARHNVAYRCAAALADRLGMQIVEFPGDHAGFVTHPRAFAARLRDVLDGNE